MPLGFCVVPVCPIRAESSHRSEQVSQLLFGEYCELLERTNDFMKIRVVYDNYEGWCQQNQLEELTSDYNTHNDGMAGEWVNNIIINSKPMHIPFGSLLHAGSFMGKNKVAYNGVSMNPKQNSINKESLDKIALTFINTPYLWGGRSVFGIDCSGFTQLVFKFLNIPLLRDASQQATQGHEVGFLQEAKAGDLAFFDNEAGKITHVGILQSASTIIHAAGKVRIDKIDSQGIINSDTEKRTHKLRLIKRIDA